MSTKWCRISKKKLSDLRVESLLRGQKIERAQSRIVFFRFWFSVCYWVFFLTFLSAGVIVVQKDYEDDHEKLQKLWILVVVHSVFDFMFGVAYCIGLQGLSEPLIE